jgi:hypothetical protein
LFSFIYLFVFWLAFPRFSSADYYLVSENPDACGKLVVTKVPGLISPDIITGSYKLRSMDSERRSVMDDGTNDTDSVCSLLSHFFFNLIYLFT